MFSFYFTGHFVPNEFTGLHFSNGGEEGANLLLRHRLRQIIDNQISFALFETVASVGRASGAGEAHAAGDMDRAIGLRRIPGDVHSVLHHGEGGRALESGGGAVTVARRVWDEEWERTFLPNASRRART